MTTPIRSVGEVLNEGTRILGLVWRRLIPPSFGAFILLGAATLAIFKLTGADAFLDLVFNNPKALEAMTDAELLAVSGDFIVGFVLAAGVQVIASGFVALAAYRLVDSEIRGEIITAGSAARFATSRLTTFLVAAGVAIVAVGAGLFLLIIPGIWFAGRFAMAAPIIGFEKTGPLAALTRSSNLVKGHWWPTVGFLLLVGLLGSVAEILVQTVAVPLLAIGSIGIGTGLAFVVTVVVQGFIIAAIAVMSAAWYRNLTVSQSA